MRSCLRLRPALTCLFLALLAGAALAAEPTKLTILHFNDVHAQTLPLKESKGVLAGGLPDLAGKIREIRASSPNVLLLSAGDNFVGSPISSLTKGRALISLLNLLSPDAACLGNHEFDYGLEALRLDLAEARYPVLLGNVRLPDARAPPWRATTVVTCGGIRVGILGLIAKDLPGLIRSDVASGLVVEDPVKTAERLLPDLQKQAQVIVALTHQGVQADRRLARRLAGRIDVIVGGHDHQLLEIPLVVGDTLIVQAGSKGQWLGRLDLWVDPESGRIVKHHGAVLPIIHGQVEPDPAEAQLVEEQERSISPKMSETIAELIEPWVRGSGESNVGNWITDATRAYCGTDVAFQNVGGIRRDQPAGPLTVRDLWEICPFNNTFVVFSLTGKQLLATLEQSVAEDYLALQVSGLRFTYDSGRPRGQRVVEVTVGGHPLDPGRSYTVATNNYVAGHSGSFFKVQPEQLGAHELGCLDVDVLVEAARQQQQISARIDGRAKDLAGQRQ